MDPCNSNNIRNFDNTADTRSQCIIQIMLPHYKNTQLDKYIVAISIDEFGRVPVIETVGNN